MALDAVFECMLPRSCLDPVPRSASQTLRHRRTLLAVDAPRDASHNSLVCTSCLSRDCYDAPSRRLRYKPSKDAQARRTGISYGHRVA